MSHLDDSLRKALHDKHKLGQSKRDSLSFSYGTGCSPLKSSHTVMRCGPCRQSQNHTRGTSSNTGQVTSGIRTWPSRDVCHTCPGNTRCPLCRGDDSQGHIFGSCMHPDMSKQYIARHDKAVRTVIQAFTKGQCGNHYLIADIGKIEGLKDIGVRS